VCHSEMMLTKTLKAVRGSEKLVVEIYACLPHHKYANIQHAKG
jgi:hypothetical protein